jgi:hypothetical protein
MGSSSTGEKSPRKKGGKMRIIIFREKFRGKEGGENVQNNVLEQKRMKRRENCAK